jgi:hypothetical protein
MHGATDVVLVRILLVCGWQQCRGEVNDLYIGGCAASLWVTVSSELTRAVAQLAGGSRVGIPRLAIGGPPLSPPETHVPTTVGGTGPLIRGLKPGQGDGLLRVIKMRRRSSFGGEMKPSAPCNKSTIRRPFPAKFLLLRYWMSAGNCQTALVDESRMPTTRKRTHNRSTWSQCKGRLVRPPRNSNSVVGGVKQKLKCVEKI